MRDEGEVQFDEFEDEAGESEEVDVPPWEPISRELHEFGARPRAEPRILRITNEERECRAYVIVRVKPSGLSRWRPPCKKLQCPKCFLEQLDQWTDYVDLLYMDARTVTAYIVDPERFSTVKRALQRAADRSEVEQYRIQIRLGPVDLVLSNVTIAPRTTGLLSSFELIPSVAGRTFQHVVESFHLDGRYGNDHTRARPIVAVPPRPDWSTGEKSLWQHRLLGDRAERFEIAYYEQLADEREKDPTLPEDHHLLARDHLDVVERCNEAALFRAEGVEW